MRHAISAPPSASHPRKQIAKPLLQEALEAGLSIVPLSTEQYHQMACAGILEEGSPVELLDGMLVWKDRSATGEDAMTVGTLHRIVVSLLAELNGNLKPHGSHMCCQNPIGLLMDSEPEPDGAVIRGKLTDYTEHLPGAKDVLSVIEVADSSLKVDRTFKLRRYAAAEIPQYIILNLIDRQAEVFEEPVAGQRRYNKSTVIKLGESIDLLVAEQTRIAVPVAQLFP